MADTNDYSRQRLADFFAARLKARRAEKNDPQPIKRTKIPTTLPHPEEDSAQTAINADPAHGTHL